ncbi:class I SAM-dependent methyltransferase [Oculatella sp. LEGE 06141]|uniref:class I SAM-dependent methyltransferase n=1 Tax=Oculatella sp. LEGE 06141 TaxID=1828648 RepID=UPI00187F678F|nr:class I SAM-dependent methyltransferase [Oculatella sp. LEGE 06141]MBE9178529.1 class I SAM-dependent methyltransferase [Oculatella sp. LEGE 06141]
MSIDTPTQSEQRFTAYDPWAWLYNQSLGPRYCHDKLPILEQLLLPQLKAGAQILDLCCGTGQITQQLSGKGYGMTGLDGSEEMLHYARHNAPNAQFILADARHFQRLTPVDAAFSVSASLNHILSLAELKQVFKNVYATLHQDGIFLFDLRLQGDYRNHPLTGGEVQDEYAWAVGESYDSINGIGSFKITIFYQVDQSWQRSDLTYYAKDYAWTDVQAALEATGFRDVQVYDQRGHLMTPDNHQMVYFLSRK